MPTHLHECLIKRYIRYIPLFLIIILQSCSKVEEILPDVSITSLQIAGITTAKITIVKESNTIEITIPYGISVKSLTPIIEITSGATVVPASKIPQDFSQPIYYVLTSAEGKKSVYKVSVITLKQPSPEIISFDKNQIEAGETIIIKGKYFGNYQGAIQAYLLNSKNEETQLTSRLIDSTQIQLAIPKTVIPQVYMIKLSVNGNTVTSIPKIVVQYPTPEIKSLSKKNILQGDTLFVNGDFISDNYTYKLQLSDGKNQVTTSVQKTSKGEYYSILNKNISSGNYTIQISNETTQKRSKSQEFSIQLYDITKPFVSGIMSPKTSYKAGEKLIFKTLNFDSFPARFFQIQLSNGKEVLFQNGIYNKTTNTLTLDLPTTLKVGNYSIVITLINTTNQEYVLELDEILVVK
jgi:hypothetical protein